MKKPTKIVILLLGALIFVFVAGGGYAFFFSVMKKRTEGVVELLARAEELSGESAKLSASVSVLKEESKRIEKLKSYFVKESEIVAFAKNIEELGEHTGAILSLESLEPGLGETNIPVLNFRAKATGKFEEVMQVVSLLENLPAKLEWKSVKLLRKSEDGIVVIDKGTFQVVKEPLWVLDIAIVVINFVHE